MFLKLLKKINVKKVIAFIILEIFILSLTPLYALQTGVDNSVKKIILNYSYNEKENTLELNWNNNLKKNEKYYIFKKDKQEKDYFLVSDENGILKNHYLTSLKENLDSYFIVCKTKKFKELSGDIKIFSLHDKKKIELNLKKLRKSESLESNEILIVLNDKLDEKSENINSNFTDLIKTEDKKVSLNHEVKNKLDKIKEEISLAVKNDKDKNTFDDNTEEKIEGLYWINKNKVTVIEYEDVKLEIPSGSTPDDSYIYIKPLTEDLMVKTPSDSHNLTLKEDETIGYDISLNGDSDNRFLKDIKISIKYDEKKIPQEIKKTNVFAYYYDENIGQWQYLKRDSLENGYITSTTNHFCQFYAGTMSVQSEPPQSKGINTDPINIEEVDPMAGIKGLPEVNPNNYGSANFSYPISLPEGINDLTPKVSISYSSNGREGNCGYGWNLGMSAITIDTKDGVPKYDGNDTLLLDGRELVNVGSGLYRLKNEGSFAKIVKSADGFIVYHTDGKKMYYGETDGSRLYDPDNISHVFIYYLNKAEDKFGNIVTYEYEEVTEDSKRVNLYLKTIKYGHNEVYTVNFNWEDRSDIRSNGRGTFLIINKKRLKLIDVKYKTNILKKEILTYKSGVFNKTLMIKIEEKSANDQVINSLSFEYDDTITDLFSDTIIYPAPAWDVLGHEDLRYNCLKNGNRHTEVDFVDLNGDGLADRVAKHREDSNFYIQLNTGDGFIDHNPISVNDSTFIANSANKDLRYVYDSIHTEIDFVDINGDGLPDRVAKHRENNDFYVQLNQGFNFTDTQTWLAPAWDVLGHEDLRYTCLKDGNSHTEVDFVDINGDGLADRVAKHREDSNFYIQLNAGDGFIDHNPISVNDSTFIANSANKDLRYVYDSIHTEIDFVDINGDGLPDRVAKHRENNDFYVQLNQGFSFTDTQTWLAPAWDVLGHEDLRYTCLKDGNSHTEVDFVDINGDGLPDRVAKHREDSNFYIQLNKGDGFIDLGAFPVNDSTFIANSANKDLRYVYDSIHTEIDFVDINGDGLPDRVAKHRENNDFYVQLNNLGNKNRIKKITNDISGLETSLEFERVHLDSNKDIAHNYSKIKVLSSITTGNSDLSLTTTIEYEDGIYDRLERQFRGFKKLTTKQYNSVDAVTSISENTYRVDDITGYDECNNPIYDEYIRGQVDSTISSYLKDGETEPVILHKKKNNYTKVSILTGHDDVKMVFTDEVREWLYDYDGNFVGVDETNGDISKQAGFVFDYTNGLITQSTKIKYNDPHHNNDDNKVITDFAVNTADWISVFYKKESIDNKNDSRISMKTLYYDGLGEGLVSNGILSSEKIWNNNGDDPVTYFEFDAYGNSTKINGSDGLEVNIAVNYIADDNYYKEEIKTLPDGLTETAKYDIYSRLKETTDVFGDLSVIDYDNYGRIIQVQQTLNDVLTTIKTFSFEILTVNDKTYFKAEANYLDDPDTIGFLTMQFFKDSLGRMEQTKIESVVDGVKMWSVSGKKEYDDMGRVTTMGSISTADYTDNGLIDTGMVSPLSYASYDEMGRKESATLTSGLIIYYDYDISIQTGYNGYNRILISETTSDSEGHEGTVYKDILEQEVMSKMLKENSQYATTLFDYDLHGYAKVTESTGSIGEKQVDSLGRTIWMKTPDAGKIEYVYNSIGLVTLVKEYGKNESDWREVNYVYDSLNRITNIDYYGIVNDVAYTYYDNTGEGNRFARSCMKNVSKSDYFSVLYNYDQMWVEEIKTIESSAYTTKYEYDVQGRIKNLTYPDGEIVTYTYDDGGLLNRIIGSEIYVDDIKYDEFGQRTYVKYGNGSEMTYSYDSTTRLLDIYTAKDKNGLDILKYDYDFDILGHITKITDKPGDVTKSIQNYQYDFMKRLTHADGDHDAGTDTYEHNYSYDDDNRILQKTYANGMIYNYNYLGDSHAISSINVINGTGGKTNVNFDYDEYSNMTEKEVYADTTLLKHVDYTYDNNNRLVNLNDTVIDLNFKYDAGGQRIRKVFEDEVGVIKETTYVSGFYTISDGMINKHISDGQNIVATKVDNNPVNTLFYHSNHIGSTAALTDNDGLKAQSYLYHPYGEMWVVEDGEILDEVTRLFTGQEYDKESGLYYMNARYYDPDLGIFLRPDPSMDGLNHYAYCGGNPVMYFDPTGCEANWGVIDMIVGTIISIIANIASAARGKGYAGYSSTIVGAIDLLTNALSDGAVDVPDQITDQFRTSTIIEFSTGSGDPESGYNYEPSNPFETSDNNFELFFQTFKPGLNESTIKKEETKSKFEYSKYGYNDSDVNDFKDKTYKETWYATSIEIYAGMDAKIIVNGVTLKVAYAWVTFKSDQGVNVKAQYSIYVRESISLSFSFGAEFYGTIAKRTFNEKMAPMDIPASYGGSFESIGAGVPLIGFPVGVAGNYFRGYDKNGNYNGWSGGSAGLTWGRSVASFTGSGGLYKAIYELIPSSVKIIR